MTCRTYRAGLGVAVSCLTVVAGCSGNAVGLPQDPGLRLIGPSIVSGGDEHDEIGTSQNGSWWVIARYPSNRVVRVNIRSGVVDKVPRLRRHSGAAYTITNTGRVGKPVVAPPRADLVLDRTELGHQLVVSGHAVYVSDDPRQRGRLVARGYPRLEIEQEPSFSNGSLSGDGETVTIPTARSYDSHDRNHALDIYQFDLRTGQVTWVSRESSFGGHGLDASPNGRYVIFDGTREPQVGPGPDHRGSTSDAPLRWDRRSGHTTVISPAHGSGPRHGVSGQFSIANSGRAAFVANDCDLTVQPPPEDATACLYSTQPAPRATKAQPPA